VTLSLLSPVAARTLRTGCAMMAAASQAGSASQATMASQTVFRQTMSVADRREIRARQRDLAQNIQGAPCTGHSSQPRIFCANRTAAESSGFGLHTFTERHDTLVRPGDDKALELLQQENAVFVTGAARALAQSVRNVLPLMPATVICPACTCSELGARGCQRLKDTASYRRHWRGEGPSRCLTQVAESSRSLTEQHGCFLLHDVR